jgi:uncharacterized membrane protein
VAIADPSESSTLGVVRLVYLLHALGIVIGAFGSASVAGSFLFGWPSIVAVIINYARRSDARGTWLESHFRWQIRTFWFALLWAAIVFAISVPLAVILVGIGTWVVGMCVLGAWAACRIGRGWVRLGRREAMPI